MKKNYSKLLRVFNKEIAITFGVMLVMIFSISSCTEDVTVIGLPDNPIDTTAVVPQLSFKTDVAPLFDANCATCHHHAAGATSGVDLSAANAYASLMGNNSKGIVYIKAGDPDNSVLMDYLTANGENQMPTSGLNPEVNAAVSTWIQQGAKNN